MVWSPPSVITRGWCFPSLARGTSGAPVSESFGSAENGVRCSSSLCPVSICLIACALSYGVTGMSPQSTIFSPDKNGLTSNGTLYPPYNVRRRDPARIPAGPKRAPGLYDVPVSCRCQCDDERVPSVHVEEGVIYRLTNGAPRNAISNGTFLSFVRHWTHGSLAKVVMPEKMESAVTNKVGRRDQKTPEPLRVKRGART